MAAHPGCLAGWPARGARRRAHRGPDRLGAAAPDVRFIHLHGPDALLAQRLAARPADYMPASLLRSQIDTVEPPGDDENAITLNMEQPPQLLLAPALHHLGSGPG